MNENFDPGNVGEELGLESMRSVIANIETYCAHEERRITLTNQPEILALRTEYSRLLKEEERLEDRLKRAPRPGERILRKSRSLYYWSVTAFLALAGFVFTLLSFDPYRLGWKSYLYCFGIAVVTPFLVERIIDLWKLKTALKWAVTLACLAALLSLGLLAVIRSDLFAAQFKETTPAVVIEDEPSAPQPENSFYQTTLPLLRIVMVLLAFAMELGAGFALHDAWRIGGESPEDWDRLERELRDVRGRMTELVYEITRLQNEPAVFVSRFWRNFYRAVLTHTTRSSMTKLILAVMLVLPFANARATVPERLTVVVAVDLTESVATHGPDRQSEFNKNIDAVTRFLAHVPGGCRVVVLGITDRSFVEPYILLNARTADDPGYFGERLESAHKELVRLWRNRARALTPRFRETDILGAFILAAQIFGESEGGRKILVVLSDMRHSTRELDLESENTVQSFMARKRNSRSIAPARLNAVAIYVLGADGAGKSVKYWHSLEEFWREYFEASGASVQRYSVLRELPEIGQ